jgi:hypothetical protein
MNYAYNHDKENFWFCFLTDSCCPIVSPERFRYLFFKNYNKSVISWRKAWWNPNFHKRANLRLLHPDLRLANDPWFILKREDVINCCDFIQKQPKLTKTICSGGLANESLFAIILYSYNKLSTVINKSTHISDWSKMESTTSPYLFKNGDIEEQNRLKKLINSKDSNFNLFIRKIDSEFPDEILKEFIFPLDEKKQIEKTKRIILFLKIISLFFFLILYFLFYSF